ncbi:hypothetical protein Dimus_004544 [Dionaea muscipula]
MAMMGNKKICLLLVLLVAILLTMQIDRVQCRKLIPVEARAMIDDCKQTTGTGMETFSISANNSGSTTVGMSQVQCRKLRLASGTAMMGDCNQAAATNPFVVAANNSGSTSSAMETLGFILASGPSKKGAGH